MLAACSLLLGVGTECRLPGHDQRLAAGRLLRTDPHSSLLTLPFFSTSSFPLTLRSSPRLPPSQSLEVGGYFAASSAVRVSVLPVTKSPNFWLAFPFLFFFVCVFLFFAPFFFSGSFMSSGSRNGLFACVPRQRSALVYCIGTGCLFSLRAFSVSLPFCMFESLL